ncbi:MAG TPA: SDR family NAD(P)-dependent oxidoreductase [Vicinamibacteria bacterium]|nr:SDR family NAD(P)-dependent oxidoreductase [Vicinamibacteria bacterium]
MTAESLKGRVAIVTGSGHGLGASLARAAAARGAAVVVNCRSDGVRAQTLADELGREGGRALAVRADVADYEQAGALVGEALHAFGRIDVLFNTVGAFLWKPVADLDPREWRATVSSNLDSVFNMCRLVLPPMRQSRYGRIVSFGAVGAERALGQPEVAAYSAAKAAVIAFSRALALEEARGGITVNVVCPGVFVDGDEAAPYVVQRVPVGRAGTHEDIVRAALFFASPAADFVTGQVLSVAGGEGL